MKSRTRIVSDIPSSLPMVNTNGSDVLYETILSGNTLAFYNDSVETADQVIRLIPRFDTSDRALLVEYVENNVVTANLVLGEHSIRTERIHTNAIQSLDNNDVVVHGNLVQSTDGIIFYDKPNNSFVTKQDVIDFVSIDLTDINFDTSNLANVSWVTSTYYDKAYVDANLANVSWVTGTYYDKAYVDANLANVSWVTGTYYDRAYVDANLANVAWVTSQYYDKEFVDANLANVSWVTSQYYDKEFVDANLANVSWVTSQYYDKEYVNANLANVSWVTSQYYDKAYVDANLANVGWVTSQYYDKEFVDANLANVSWVTSQYYDKEFVDANLANVSWVTSQYYDKTYVDTNLANVSWVTSQYYDKTYVDTNLANVSWVTFQYYDKEFVDANLANVAWVTSTYYDKEFVDNTFPTINWVTQLVGSVQTELLSQLSGDSGGSITLDLVDYVKKSNLADELVSHLAPYANTDTLESTYAKVIDLAAYTTTTTLASTYANITHLTNVYATKTELANEIANIDFSSDVYATKTELANAIANIDISGSGDGGGSVNLGNYYTKTEIDTSFYTKSFINNNYYTIHQVNTLIADSSGGGGGGSVDLSNYVTHLDLYRAIVNVNAGYSVGGNVTPQYLGNYLRDNDYVRENDINTYLDEHDYLQQYEIVALIQSHTSGSGGDSSTTNPDTSIFVTQTQLYQAILNVNSGFGSNGNVTPAFVEDYLETNKYTTDQDVKTLINTYGNGNVTTTFLMENYVSKEMWNNFVVHGGGSSSSGGSVSLDGYATEAWVTNQLSGLVTGGGGTGTGSGGTITGVIDLNGYVTTTYADETYMKKSDMIQDPDADETVIEYPVHSNINVFKIGFERFIQADVVTLDDDNVSYYFSSSGTDEYILFELRNYSTPIINGVTITSNTSIFVQIPVYSTENAGKESGARGENTIYNGMYDIIDNDTTTGYLTLKCQRSPLMDSVDDCIGTIVNIKSNNHSYIITTPNETHANVLGPNPFVFDTDLFEIHNLMTAEYGTMASQHHDDVHITGGSIQVPALYVSELRPRDGESEISIRLPDNTDNTAFRVRATPLETTADADSDVVFEVDGTGLVSAFQFNSLSDRSLKTNEATIVDSIGLVKKLHGKTFDWIDPKRNKNPGHKQYGFIAQEVAVEFPTLVAETLNEHLTVDYAKVVSILVEAVKTIHDAAIAAGLDMTNTTTSGGGSGTNVCGCCGQTSTNNNDSTSGTVTVTQRPVPGDITTNVISLGSVHKSVTIANMATTPNDEIDVSELFDSGNYIIYTNKGTNTIDGAVSNVGDVVLVKDSPNKAFNGVYQVTATLEGAQGLFSRAVRHPDFKEFGNIVGSTVVVEPSGFAGRGKGTFNPGHTFVCIHPSNVEAGSFALDTSPIEFVNLEKQNYGTMAYQDANDVAITGGTISMDAVHTSEIRPQTDTSDVSVHLESTTQTFKVKNNSGTSMCEVNHSGIVTANDFFSPSDERLKTNVSSITHALSLVRQLHGVTFDWKDPSKNDPNHKQYGFIAQEVALHFPTLVHTRSDDKLSVDYSKVVSILVEAVKDLGSMLNL